MARSLGPKRQFMVIEMETRDSDTRSLDQIERRRLPIKLSMPWF